MVGVSAGNTHDSEDLKPMLAGLQSRHDPCRGQHYRAGKLHADKAYARPDLRRCCGENGSRCASPTRASSPASDLDVTAG